GFHLCRLPSAGADRSSRPQGRSYGDAVALHRIRRQRHRRGGCDRAAGRHRQCRQRRAAALWRRTPAFADDPAPRAGGDQRREQGKVYRGGAGGGGMKPVNFDYARPADVGAALALLADDSLSVKLMAGGQSLGPMLNMRLVQPDLLVDITGIEELKRVEERAGEIVLGGCITHADIEDLRVPDVTCGALPSVARGIAYRAVRNRGTVGGSLTHADPSADWLSILSALGAKVTLRGPSGNRTIPVEDY